MARTIALIDIRSKMPNLALMKLSAWHKAQGDTVVLNPASATGIDHAYGSILFSQDRPEADKLRQIFPSIEFGGSGVDLHKDLPPEIEAMRPDYDLYTVEGLYTRMRGVKSRQTRLKRAELVVNAGIGFTTRGCIRRCEFCVVPKKEGAMRQVGPIADLLNPRSNRLILLDNNFTADPLALDKLREIEERGLEISITQGIDIRTVTPELAQALSRVKLFNGTIHYAWDLMAFEDKVLAGIQRLLPFLKAWKHMCYMLVGFNTTFEEDMYRYRKLWEENRVHPYVMIYNKGDRPDGLDERLKHFARWVNSRVHKTCPRFDDYDRWKRVQERYLATRPLFDFGAHAA